MTGIGKRLDRFAEAEIDGEIVLMEQETGSFFTLRGTGAAVWALIDGVRDRDAIRGELDRRYDGPAEAIDRELDDFLRALRERGLVA